MTLGLYLTTFKLTPNSTKFESSIDSTQYSSRPSIRPNLLIQIDSNYHLNCKYRQKTHKTCTPATCKMSELVIFYVPQYTNSLEGRRLSIFIHHVSSDYFIKRERGIILVN
ncbi:hypothetical protein O6H91_03G056200 [Diphasiastrum complanatum]|uniref:Uncharacterized protein n=1 Tax=Diphasiastrum complanatum TaxID=34168 RepID=A0ACC2E6L0_DIPCM|nr:hypothetical protein O6H91_03G056200 [Diphasiastrum complanatum]